MSYADLSALANQFGRSLIDRVVPHDVVCISGRKTVNTFACMLACLRIGAVYSILDQDSPVERLRKIISTCKPKVLLADANLLSKLKEIIAELRIIDLDGSEETLVTAIAGYDAGKLVNTRKITGTNPAYIMFTSGSTGFPKGAVMTHSNVLNLVDWSRETFSISCDDRLTNVNPLYFDNSVFDFYSALMSGACLVPFRRKRPETRGLPKKLTARSVRCGSLCLP